MKRKDSDSSVQRKIEKIILSDLKLEPGKINVDAVKFEFDGYDKSTNHLFEIYAGLEKLRSAQRQKISQDILKMILFDLLNKSTSKKTIIVVDDKIRNELIFEEHKSWKNLAIKEYGIEILLYTLDEEIMNELIEAKKKQGSDFISK